MRREKISFSRGNAIINLAEWKLSISVHLSLNVFFFHYCDDVNVHMVVTVKVQIVGILRLINSRIYWSDIVRMVGDDRQNSTIWIKSKTGTAFFRFALRTIPRLVWFRHKEPIECIAVDHKFLFPAYTNHVAQPDI